MLTYIDESGTFVSPAPIGSWSVVAALAIPEGGRRALAQTLEHFKVSQGLSRHSEVKLGSVSEDSYIALLTKLARARVALFAIAVDAGLADKSAVEKHQAIQVSKIRENIPRMLHEGGRAGVENLAQALEQLSPQLYAQLVCQTELVHEVLVRGTLYFVQRTPQALGHLRWRIDEKNSARPSFERTFSWTALGLLQSKSLRSPLLHLEGADYSYFERNAFAPGTAPTHLELPSAKRIMPGLDLRKLFTENLKFVDSKSEPGVQIVDLLASGLRRSLRGQFNKNHEISMLLGQLMIQNSRGKHPIHLVSFGSETTTESHTTKAVQEFIRNAKGMLAIQ